ncbi:MAG: hypothetical protein HQM11_09060 [SAR324 cluster bacterium]|nr:hypothetical protein [SAR324 cluster bacterium]
MTNKLTQYCLGMAVCLTTVFCGWGCSTEFYNPDDEDQTSNTVKNADHARGLKLTEKAVQGTPQIFGGLSSGRMILGGKQKFEANNTDAASRIEPMTQQVIESFFKAECHNDGNGLDFCPPGTDTGMETKFSTTTLIGAIYHADLYLGNIYGTTISTDSSGGYKSCASGNGKELTNHTPIITPENATRFLIDFGSLFDCAGSETSDNNTTYFLYSKAKDNQTFASLVTRKEQYAESFGATFSDINQSYLKNGDAVILAFNLADNWDYGRPDNASNRRTVVITNVTTHKFIVKRISTVENTISNDQGNHLVALGKAGYDSQNNTWIEGFYMVKADYQGTNQATVCVQNGLNPAIVSDDNCAEISGFFVDGWTIAQVYSWLEIPETDRTNISGFNAFFENSAFLNNDHIPLNTSDYFPDSITN